MKESNAQILKRLRADAVKRGLCYVCRCRFPRPGIRTCDKCLEDSKERGKSGKGLEGRRRHSRARSARVKAARKAAGLCRCGRRPPLAGYAACITCLDYTAKKTRESIRAKNGSKAEPLCTVCRKPGHNKRRHERPGVLW